MQLLIPLPVVEIEVLHAAAHQSCVLEIPDHTSKRATGMLHVVLFFEKDF